MAKVRHHLGQLRYGVDVEDVKNALRTPSEVNAPEWSSQEISDEVTLWIEVAEALIDTAVGYSFDPVEADAAATARVYRTNSPRVVRTDWYAAKPTAVKVGGSDAAFDWWIKAITQGAGRNVLCPGGRWSGFWPRNGVPIEITAVWGFSEVPRPVRGATLRLAARLFKEGDVPLNVLETVEGGMRLPPLGRATEALIGRWLPHVA